MLVVMSLCYAELSDVPLRVTLPAAAPPGAHRAAFALVFDGKGGASIHRTSSVAVGVATASRAPVPAATGPSAPSPAPPACPVAAAAPTFPPAAAKPTLPAPPPPLEVGADDDDVLFQDLM